MADKTYTSDQYMQAGKEAYKEYKEALAAGDDVKAERLLAEATELLQLYDDQVYNEAVERGAGELPYSFGAGALRGAGESVDFLGQAPDKLFKFLEAGGAAALRALGLEEKVSEGVKKAIEPLPSIGPAVEALDPLGKLLGQGKTASDVIADVSGGYSAYESPMPVGRIAGTMGEFTGGAATMPIGGPLRSMASVQLPAIASEVAGQTAEQYAPEYESIARMAAALGIPVAQALATPALRRMAIGDPSEVRAYIPESKRAQSVNLLQRLGIEDMSAGQQLGSEQLMRLEGAMAPSLASQRQLTSAVAKEAGMDAQLLTSGTLKKNRDRLGQIFDKADDAITLPPTTEEASRASLALDEALNSLEARTAGAFPRLTGIGDAIIDAAGNRKALNPKEVSRIRSDLRKEMDLSVKGINANDQIRYELAHDLNEILDDMVMRSVTQADPDLAAQLSTARNQYRAHLTIERAMNRAGSDARAGILSPTALAGALRRREGTSFLRGTGTELARIGAAAEEVLSPLPTVSAGGVRSGLLDKITSPISSTAAATMQSTLPLQAGVTIPTELAKRVLRQTGGLLSVQ